MIYDVLKFKSYLENLEIYDFIDKNLEKSAVNDKNIKKVPF